MDLDAAIVLEQGFADVCYNGSSHKIEFQIKNFENANISKDLDIFGSGRDSQL